MASARPQVSVIMPVHNADAYVLEAVSSILNQTFEDFELIVVDDDSSDRGVKRIRGIADKRVQLVLNHRRLGVAGALNRGLELASGELIARMDADDVAHPDRLTRQVEFMRAEPGVGVLGTACRVINADASQVLGVATYPSDPAVVGFDMYFTCAVAPPSAMIRAAVLRDAGGFATGVPYAETYHLWLRLSPLGQFANLSEPLLSYRAHAEQVSTRHRTARERNYDLIRGMGLFDLLGQELPEKTLAGWNRLARELPIEDEETFDAAIELVEQARQGYLRSKHLSGSAAEAVTARTVDRFVYAARLNSDALPDAASRALVRVETLRNPLPSNPFQPAVTPLRLDGRRRTAFLYQPRWSSDSWQEVLVAYAQSFQPDEGVTLVWWIDPDQGVSAADAGERMEQVLHSNGLDEIPDMLLVTDRLDSAGVDSLYAAVDWVIPNGEAIQRLRAIRSGVRVLRDPSPTAWRAAAGIRSNQIDWATDGR